MPVFDEDKLRNMGYVCDWCGKVGQVRSCPNGCTKICIECFDKKGWKHTFCKKCGKVIKR